MSTRRGIRRERARALYLALYAEAKDPVVLRRALDAPAASSWRHALELAPRWLLTLALLPPLGVLGALFLFTLRDAGPIWREP